MHGRKSHHIAHSMPLWELWWCQNLYQNQNLTKFIEQKDVRLYRDNGLMI